MVRISCRRQAFHHKSKHTHRPNFRKAEGRSSGKRNNGRPAWLLPRTKEVSLQIRQKVCELPNGYCFISDLQISHKPSLCGPFELDTYPARDSGTKFSLARLLDYKALHQLKEGLVMPVLACSPAPPYTLLPSTAPHRHGQLWVPMTGLGMTPDPRKTNP